MKTPKDLLGSDNYFHWPFNMRMHLARKGLLAHIEVPKADAEMTSEWMENDMKALAIIAMGIAVEHQGKIRAAATALQAWVTLSDYYNRANIHNRVALTRRLHDFKMEDGASMAAHLDRFDELVVAMEAVGDAMDEPQQLVILLGSLPSSYDMLVSIIENMTTISLIEVKEKLLKEHVKLENTEKVEETAFKARFRRQPRKQGARGFQKGKGGGRPHHVAEGKPFSGRCFNCNQTGHKKKDCTRPQGGRTGAGEVLFMANTRVSGSGWLLDSGASSHMSPSRSDFETYTQLPERVEVRIADGEALTAVGVGDVRVVLPDGTTAVVSEVLHIPGLDRRLMSVAKLVQRGFEVVFGQSKCTIIRDGEVILKIQQLDNVYRFDVAVQQARVAEQQCGDAWKLWHARLGHVSHDNYRRLLGASDGLPHDLQRGDDLCGGCARGKQAAAPFPKAPFRGIVKASRVLELIHTDLMGPMKTKSAGGAKYILLFIDDYSRYITVYLLKAKSEVPMKFKEYKNTMERRLGARIRYVRSDNGSEYVNNKFAKICMDGGIVHQRTVPYTPRQNGLAERTNRTVMEMARSMMMYREVDAEWWGYAVKCAEYLLNRMTSTVNPDVTPVEICFEIVPTLEHTRVFGGEGFAYVDAKQRTKLDPKAFRCMMLGYAEDGKGYRVLDLEQNKVKVVRTVVLDERELGGIYPLLNIRDVSGAYTYQEMQIDDTTVLPTMNATQRRSNNDDVTMAEPEGDQDGDEPMPVADQEPEQHANGDQLQPAGPVAPPTLPALPTNANDAIVFHPMTRRRSLSQVNTRILPSDSPVSTARNRNRLMLPNSSDGGSDDRQIVVYNHNTSEYESKTDSDDEPPAKRSRVNGEEGEEALSATVHALGISIPSSYEEATTGTNKREWTLAIPAEIESLVLNHTWDVVSI